jgi:crotonobetainyl-CoA:carnitine CoA-transferase CaiB-like acyl-CoA transferase
MQLGEVGNPDALPHGKPLDGVRILAAEQMQSLPFATQLLARLGADVVKVEHPTHGESGRGSTPAMTDPEGRQVGATFLRNNLNKRSLGLDLRSEAGRDLFLRLVPRFDVVADNFKPGTMAKFGLGYADLASVHPGAVVVSISGFGNTGDSPYRDWPAYNSIVEAMSGIYDYMRPVDGPPRVNPMGAVADITAGLFAVIGILAALRHREATGLGQHVDLAMFDTSVALADLIVNFQSLGIPRNPEPAPFVITPVRCSDGYVVLQFVREHQFERLADLVGHPEWKDDSRFAERTGWGLHLADVILPAIEAWAGGRTRVEVADALAAENLVAGPSLTSDEVVVDPHLVQRNMIVATPRTDGVDEPVLLPGNPIKMSRVAEGPETRVPWVGEHTAEVLEAELGLGADELAGLRADGVITD